MPQPKKGPRLGSGPKHQKLMLSNLAISLFEHERVRTTEAKAKALRPFAERLITKAKKGSVHDRRLVLSDIEDRDAVHKLFTEIGPRFAERNGGYTRILKLGQRNGDGAPMVLIELVEGAKAAQEEAPESGRRRVRRPSRRRPAATGEAAETEDAAETEAAGDAERSPESESIAEASEEAGGDEPVEAPGDAGAETAQDEPEGDEEEKTDS